MKRIFLFGIILLSFAISKSQDCFSYYPNKVGAVSEYTNYDDKDKKTSISTSKIEKFFTSGDTSYVRVYSEIKDVKTDSITKTTYNVGCKDNVLYLGFQNFGTMNTQNNMSMEIQGDYISLPSKLQVGQSLANGLFTIIFKSAETVMFTTQVNITNRKVENQETITTPAGTFDCFVISYQTDTKMAFIKSKSFTKQWYNTKYGLVKTEIYNEKNKLISKQILTKVDNF